jgi:hypothetical protein
VSNLFSGVAIQEITGGDSQPVFEPQNIVWGKGKIEIGAASGEARNTRVASEGEFAVLNGLHPTFFQFFFI